MGSRYCRTGNWWIKRLGLRIGTNQGRFSGGSLKLSDTESVNFHRVPNQVLYQAEPFPDKPSGPLNTR